jgi:Domain of unknown function (DUF4288)
MTEKSKNKTEKSEVFISPVDWYIAGIMLRFEVVNEQKINLESRCIAWENKHLVKAKHPEQAYEKALKIGQESEDEYVNTDGENVKWIFEGLTTLVAVYEELEDGAEIIWIEHENKAIKAIKKRVKTKEHLEAFQRD